MAVDAYSEFATISLAEKDEAFVVEFSDFSPEIGEALMDHFSNHALYATVSVVRGDA